MTADGHFQVPLPTNEPVRSYGPGDPNRRSLRSRLAELTDARTEVPMVLCCRRQPAQSPAAEVKHLLERPPPSCKERGSRLVL
jgi:1-pyrroline-5-carboxylate dehydrogenase